MLELSDYLLAMCFVCHTESQCSVDVQNSNIENSTSLKSNYAFKENVTAVCNPGYWVKTSAVRGVTTQTFTCDNNGKWSPADLRCEGVSGIRIKFRDPSMKIVCVGWPVNLTCKLKVEKRRERRKGERKKKRARKRTEKKRGRNRKRKRRESRRAVEKERRRERDRDRERERDRETERDRERERGKKKERELIDLKEVIFYAWPIFDESIMSSWRDILFWWGGCFYCNSRNFHTRKNFVLSRCPTFVRYKFSYSDGCVTYSCIRARFSYAIKFRTFSQKVGNIQN